MPGLDTRGLFWSARADSHRSWLFKSIPYEWGVPLVLENRHRIGNKDKNLALLADATRSQSR